LSLWLGAGDWWKKWRAARWPETGGQPSGIEYRAVRWCATMLTSEPIQENSPERVTIAPVLKGSASGERADKSRGKNMTTVHEAPRSEMSSDSRANQLPPVVLDVGKTKQKLIRALKRGEGKLMEDVAEAVEAIRSNLGPELEGKALIPVVIVYQRKTNRRGGLLSFVF
jgi:hypothetical protein